MNSIHLFSFSLALLILAILFGFFPIFIRRFCTEMVVTNKRIIHAEGLVRRKTEELDCGAVESVELTQGIWGRILNYGNVSVKGKGIGDVNMIQIDNPIGLRNAVRAR